jgi:hypothetical protein
VSVLKYVLSPLPLLKVGTGQGSLNQNQNPVTSKLVTLSHSKSLTLKALDLNPGFPLLPSVSIVFQRKEIRETLKHT